ncbi:MAG: hypothetical protein ABSA83_19045 [Verrucomicrobiota bacterium]|jgi:hypothetical protein
MKLFGIIAKEPKRNEAGPGEWAFSLRPNDGGANIPCMTAEFFSGPTPRTGDSVAIDGDWFNSNRQLFIVQMISVA